MSGFDNKLKKVGEYSDIIQLELEKSGLNSQVQGFVFGKETKQNDADQIDTDLMSIVRDNLLQQENPQVQKLQNDVNSAQDEVNAVQQSFFDAQKSVGIAQESVNTAQSNYSAAQSELTVAQGELAAAESLPATIIVNGVEQQNPEREKAIAAVQARVNSAQTKVNTAKNELDGAKNDLNKAKNDLNKTQNNLDKAKTTYESAKSKLEAAEEEPLSDADEEKMAQAQAKKEETEKQIKDFDEKIKELQKKIDKIDEQISDIKSAENINNEDTEEENKSEKALNDNENVSDEPIDSENITANELIDAEDKYISESKNKMAMDYAERLEQNIQLLHTNNDEGAREFLETEAIALAGYTGDNPVITSCKLAIDKALDSDTINRNDLDTSEIENTSDIMKSVYKSIAETLPSVGNLKPEEIKAAANTYYKAMGLNQTDMSFEVFEQAFEGYNNMQQYGNAAAEFLSSDIGKQLSSGLDMQNPRKLGEKTKNKLNDYFETQGLKEKGLNFDNYVLSCVAYNHLNGTDVEQGRYFGIFDTTDTGKTDAETDYSGMYYLLDLKNMDLVETSEMVLGKNSFEKSLNGDDAGKNKSNADGSGSTLPGFELVGKQRTSGIPNDDGRRGCKEAKDLYGLEMDVNDQSDLKNTIVHYYNHNNGYTKGCKGFDPIYDNNGNIDIEATNEKLDRLFPTGTLIYTVPWIEKDKQDYLKLSKLYS